MAKTKQLRVTVEESLIEDMRGMGPFDSGGGVVRKTVEIAPEKIRRGMQQTLGALQEILDDPKMEITGFKLKEITFTVGLEASGKVSLLSLAGGSMSASSGLQFTLTRADAS